MATTARRRQGASPPVLALVGRPNVGKSSLFNRLLGRRDAIVLDRPGVTRDRIERAAKLHSRVVTLQDTGGIVPDDPTELVREVTRQAIGAIARADLVLLIIDARSGVTPLDEQVAEQLVGAGVPVIVVMNKCDTAALEALAADGWRLGLGEPMPVSAEHGQGIDELIERIEVLLPPPPAEEPPADDRPTVSLPDPAEELLIAIVGRPNVGKSSLVNRLVGDERVTVSSIPGTTRDAIDVQLKRDGRLFRLIDTAGLRREPKTESQDESVGILMARRRLERCHVAVQVVDAAQGLTSGDVSIAGEIFAAAKPMVLVFNKWDLVEQAEERMKKLEADVQRRLSFLPSIPRLTISATSGQRAFRVLDTAASLAAAASKKVSTGVLNRFLASTSAQHIVEGGRVPKMLYITQTGTLPPRFVIFCRNVGKVSTQDRRFIESRLREEFDLGPVPVVVEFRAAPRR